VYDPQACRGGQKLQQILFLVQFRLAVFLMFGSDMLFQMSAGTEKQTAKIPILAELQEMAQLEGVELIGCQMTIDRMEIKDNQLMGGV
jgi:peroxiredoxin family protein